MVDDVFSNRQIEYPINGPKSSNGWGCLSICLPVCLFAYLFACRPTYLPVCLHVCLPVLLHIFLPACLSACMSVYLPAYIMFAAYLFDNAAVFPDECIGIETLCFKAVTCNFTNIWNLKNLMCTVSLACPVPPITTIYAEIRKQSSLTLLSKICQ